jgi:hypothetical protein
MKLKAAKRARIARVRRIQHTLAAADATRAETHANMLETSAERLLQLRQSMSVGSGKSDGASLASLSELAMRLDNARIGLTDAIASARANATHHADMRLEARRRQESADKLGARSAQALADFLERNAIVGNRRKTRSTLGDKR